MPSDAVFKLCIFGDGGVGKTTMTQKYVTGIFDEATRMTIGTDFHIKKLKIEGLEVLLQIWDFAGERQFRFMLPSYVRGASGGIFMYDITRFSSIKNISEWLSVMQEGLKPGEKIPIVAAGSKCDLEDKRAISKGMVELVAKDRELIGPIECSAKTGQNVEEIFQIITKLMLKKANLI